MVAIPQAFDAEVGDAVEPGSHGPGSGKIETVFAEDAYHVPLEAGQAMRVLLDDANGQCSNGPGPGLSLTVAFEDGRLVADSDGEPIDGVHLTNNCRNAHQRAQFVAPVSGIYSVKVRGDAISSHTIWGESAVGGERTGEYRLRLEAG